MPDIGLYVLPRLVGLGRAKTLAMLGDTISAKEAEQMGLVYKVVPPEALISSAEELAIRLADGPKAVGVIKRAMMESLMMGLEEFSRYTILLQYQMSQTEDHKEALKAFLEHRKPLFKGR